MIRLAIVFLGSKSWLILPPLPEALSGVGQRKERKLPPGAKCERAEVQPGEGNL